MAAFCLEFGKIRMSREPTHQPEPCDRPRILRDLRAVAQASFHGFANRGLRVAERDLTQLQGGHRAGA
jgi:hypothetical protein